MDFRGQSETKQCFGVCETEEALREQRSAYESTSERAWKHVKRGGTAGYDFYSCPGKLFAVAGFFIFSGGFRYVLVHKALAQARRCKFYSQRKQKLI